MDFAKHDGWPARRSPPPWTFEEANNACFLVKDVNGFGVRMSISRIDPSLSAALMKVALNDLRVDEGAEGRHLGRIPFVHDLSADYTPSDIAVAAE